jgi:hypothetical protein
MTVTCITGSLDCIRNRGRGSPGTHSIREGSFRQGRVTDFNLSCLVISLLTWKDRMSSVGATDVTWFEHQR